MGGTEVALRPEVSGTYTPGRQPLQKRGFPGTVRPGEEDDLARDDLERDVPDQDTVAVPDGEVIDLDGRGFYSVDCQSFT